MKISYSILWFDDTEEFFDSLDLDPLIDLIKSWGFNPSFKPVSDPKDFMSHEPFHEFDLIVVDYNLEEYGHGEDFIKQIRDHDVFTEVIFYSANPASELWNAVRDKMLEGVFVAGRTSVLTKIERVAEQSVRKVLDLENVRGIVMAEVGNIDAQLDDIINAAFMMLLPEVQDAVFSKYVGRITKQHNDKSKDVSEMEHNGSIDPLLAFCDSNKKWNLLQSIGKKHPNVDMGLLGDYAEEILKPRNFLAHGKPKSQDDGSLLFEHHGHEFVFDDNVSSTLRQSLQKYSDKFNSILGILK